jgi:signal transduction histidine kinase
MSAVKCLLVDDLEENLAALSAVLRQSGVELFAARSGANALDLLLKHDMALVILDVQMPEMDGFELAEIMRSSQRTQHIPLIFITAGNRDPQRLFRGYEYGAVDFLYKPVDPRILLSKTDVFFELYRQKQQLAEELQARTETLHLHELFMGVLGHDLRNPLQHIVLNANLIKADSTDAAHHRSAQAIINTSMRMNRMIEDLLDVARIRAGKGMAVARNPDDLGNIVQNTVDEYRPGYPAEWIETSYRGDLQGRWDRDRLTQAFGNLLGNALQHGTPGRSVIIEVDGTHADHVTFSISNEGAIEPALLPVLFDPFRGGSDPARRMHAGLGLYIVQQIVRAHDGDIDVICHTPRICFQIRLKR